MSLLVVLKLGHDTETRVVLSERPDGELKLVGLTDGLLLKAIFKQAQRKNILPLLGHPATATFDDFRTNSHLPRARIERFRKSDIEKWPAWLGDIGIYATSYEGPSPSPLAGSEITLYDERLVENSWLWHDWVESATVLLL